MNPLEFLRQYRIGEYAIFDFVASFLGIYLLSPYLSKLFLKIRIDIPKKNWIFLTLAIGIVAHLLVWNITPMTRDFFDLHGHYIVKAIVIGSTILGLRNIKIVKHESKKS